MLRISLVLSCLLLLSGSAHRTGSAWMGDGGTVAQNFVRFHPDIVAEVGTVEEVVLAGADGRHDWLIDSGPADALHTTFVVRGDRASRWVQVETRRKGGDYIVTRWLSTEHPPGTRLDDLREELVRLAVQSTKSVTQDPDKAAFEVALANGIAMRLLGPVTSIERVGEPLEVDVEYRPGEMRTMRQYSFILRGERYDANGRRIGTSVNMGFVKEGDGWRLAWQSAGTGA